MTSSHCFISSLTSFEKHDKQQVPTIFGWCDQWSCGCTKVTCLIIQIFSIPLFFFLILVVNISLHFTDSVLFYMLQLLFVQFCSLLSFPSILNLKLNYDIFKKKIIIIIICFNLLRSCCPCNSSHSHCSNFINRLMRVMINLIVLLKI